MIQAADTDGDGRIDFEGGQRGPSLGAFLPRPLQAPPGSLGPPSSEAELSGSPLPGADPCPQAHSHL